MDPTDKLTYGALKAAIMIMGQDDYCMDFVTAYRERALGLDDALRAIESHCPRRGVSTFGLLSTR